MDANKQVVVIEDDQDILDMIGYILADEGYNVIGFDGVNQLERIIDLQPAVILLDNRLADGYGNKLCLSIKSNPASKHIPVILVSASSNLQKIAKDCLADEILPKPFDIDDLIAMVKRFSDFSFTA